MRTYGFPVGPLSLADEVGIEVAASVAKNLKVAPHNCTPTSQRSRATWAFA